MRFIAISQHVRFADGLRAVLLSGSHAVTHAASEEAALKLGSPASIDGVFIHTEVADARLSQMIASLRSMGYRPLFAATEIRSSDWEERALSAGAAFIFHLPWKEDFLLGRLRSILPLDASPASPRPPEPAGRAAAESLPNAAPALPAHPPSPVDQGTSRQSAPGEVPTPPQDGFIASFMEKLRRDHALNRVALFLVTEGGNAPMECAYSAGIEASRLGSASFSRGSGLGLWMSTHMVALTPTTTDVFSLDPAAREEWARLGATCAIPVQGNDELLGILFVGARITGHPPSNPEIEEIYLRGLELGRKVGSRLRELALAREKEFLSRVTELLSSGCAVFDGSLNLVYASKDLVRLLGGPSSRTFSFKALPREIGTLVTEVANGSRSSAETTFSDAGGSDFIARVSVFDEEPRRTLLQVQDIASVSADYRREIALVETDLMARIGKQFTNEIRESTARLISLGQALSVNKKDAAVIEQLNTALPKDLARLTRHALNLEILSKPVPRIEKLVKLHWAISKAWREIRIDYPAFGADWLDVAKVPEDAVLQVNAEVFGRACYEILLNAAQAVEDADQKRIVASTFDPGAGRCGLAFEDSGAGFAPEVIALASSPFVSTRKSGLGLGLTLVEKFVREAEGTLSLGGSRILPGASVALDLPISRG